VGDVNNYKSFSNYQASNLGKEDADSLHERPQLSIWSFAPNVSTTRSLRLLPPAAHASRATLLV